MSCSKTTLQIRRGVTFANLWRWATDPLVYKTVAAVSSLTPLTLTVTAHGVVNGQSVAFAELGGLDSVNAASTPPEGLDFHSATVDTVDTLHFNDIDAARDDQSYTSGGKIVYYTLVDLSTITSAQLLIFSESNPDTPVLTVAATLDNTAKSISVSMTPTAIAGLTEDQYTFVLIATANGGAPVKKLVSGSIVMLAAGAVDAA